MNKQKKNFKILLIESEAIIAVELEMKLELKGYDVRFVSTAEEALKLVTSFNPDLILTAIHLRGDMDGIDFMKLIREKKKFPVIYLTALDFMKNDSRLIDTQPVGVLSKPYIDNDLFDMINTALSKSH
jgi:CheY-like chemotaxis protein